MNIGDLAYLIDKSNIDQLRSEIDSNNKALFETFKNGNSLFHYLVKSSINEAVKIKFIFMLSDAGLDINLQNYREQTCLHLAVILGQLEIVNCLLQNGADLTIIDQADFCAYNHARRLEDKELSRKIVKIMQPYFPTYWIGIDNKDINIIRRLVNSWCRFKVKRNGKYLLDYAREKNFIPAVDLFNQLEIQMDLCFAVLACNTNKVEHIIKNNYSSLLLNFKNMKEKGGSIMLYAIKQKNCNLLKVLLQLKSNILNEYIADDLDIDYPIYFAALKNHLNEDCLKLLTPELNTSNREQNISNIFYKGMSILRYAIDIDYDTQILFNILNEKYCFRELITVRDPEFLTLREYSLKCGKQNYVNLIDKITLEYIKKSKLLRMQLALNGFDFFDENLLIDDLDLQSWAKKKEDKELIAFLENVKSYQNHIKNFHRAVEKNDYYNVKALQKVDMKLKEFKTDEIFYENLFESRCKYESQTVFHKAVLNGYYEILSLLLDSYIEIDVNKKIYSKLDQIRDHCYRTPYHYAMGMENNNRIIQLLSQFGFSTNVFDKDGMGPLDFQERSCSKELKDLVQMHKLQEYDSQQEPNPWSWSVWTRIRREKDAFKQLISVSHPCLHQIEKATAHGHSHDHLHSHDPHETKLPASILVQNLSQSTNNLTSNNYYSKCVLL